MLSGLICLMTSLAMVGFELNGVQSPSTLPARPFGVWATLVVAMIITCVPVAQVLKMINSALVQSESDRQALHESEERFRNMADATPVMIWVSDEDKLGTFFNKAWLEFTGRRMAEELGNGWAVSIHPDDVHHCLAIYSSSFDARRIASSAGALHGF
jgi:PAS domain-containing protein